MLLTHILFAVLSAWRITELFTMDRITERFRTRFPIYLWTCPRCMSVWASIAAAAIFHFAPFLNWPLAMSWLYVLQGQTFNLVFKKNDRQILIEVDGSMNISVQSKLGDREVVAALQRVVAQMLGKLQDQGVQNTGFKPPSFRPADMMARAAAAMKKK